jgi:hypothetical protein
VTPMPPNTTMGVAPDLRLRRNHDVLLETLYQQAAEPHEQAARHRREAAKLHELKDLVAAADQVHMAADH